MIQKLEISRQKTHADYNGRIISLKLLMLKKVTGTGWVFPAPIFRVKLLLLPKMFGCFGSQNKVVLRGFHRSNISVFAGIDLHGEMAILS
jgi:hypothetical protein